MAHVAEAPTPYLVKYILIVHLHGHHHGVGHALRADVVVARVGEIGRIRVRFPINGVFPADQLSPGFVDASFDLFLLEPGFGEKVGIYSFFHISPTPR